jgi:hypothetical protein
MGEAAGEVTGWEDRPSGEALTSDGVTGDPEVDQLVEEIEVTRVEMTGTVEEIGDRLDPKNINKPAKRCYYRTLKTRKIKHQYTKSSPKKK